MFFALADMLNLRRLNFEFVHPFSDVEYFGHDFPEEFGIEHMIYTRLQCLSSSMGTMYTQGFTTNTFYSTNNPGRVIYSLSKNFAFFY